MTRKTIIVTTELPKPVEQMISEHFDIKHGTARPAGPDFFKKADGAFAVIPAPGDTFCDETIGRLPASIRLLASYSIGTDHIDLEAAKARNIAVSNTPNVLTQATADLAIHLMLAAARGASRAERNLRDGLWTGWSPDQVFGVDLSGKTLGIFGYGRIGKAVAHRAAAFGMKTVYYDRRGTETPDSDSTPIGDWDTFLGSIDVLSLHAPSTAETRNIIDAEAIAKLGRGAIFINTARGNLVDDNALIKAARCGHLHGIGLDVFRDEPNLNSGYLALPNATLLPHIGSSTLETRLAMGQIVLDNLIAQAGGTPLPHGVV